MKWISVKDALPEIDYDNKKSSAKVRIKINDNEDLCLDCHYRQTFSLGQNGQPDRVGYVFYTMDGKTYTATHWMYAAKKKKTLRDFDMELIEADPEDQREILRAALIIHKAINENHLQIPYVMEALQGLYASRASDMVSYEEYCEKIDIHKNYYKDLWQEKT